jgi:hypothetical protein
MADMQVPDKVKSFWEKKEGRTGMIFTAGGIFGVLLIMMKFGAALVAAAANTVILGAYVIGIVVVASILMNPRFRAMCSFIFQSAMRWITSFFITIDPIGILKDYVEDLKASHAKMDEQIGKLKGVLAGLTRTIKDNQETMKNSLNLAQKAKERMGQAVDPLDVSRMRMQAKLKSNKAGRLKESNRTYQELYNKIEMIYRVLCKMYTNCEFIIEDTEDSIKIKETEWKAVRAAHGAMKSAMSVINGNSDKRAIFEQTLEYMANDLDTKVGEMERFMEVSQGFLDGVDLQNGVFEEKGFEMLEQWEKDADSWILGDEKATIIADSNNPNNILNLDRATVSGQPGANQYGNLFNKK